MLSTGDIGEWPWVTEGEQSLCPEMSLLGQHGFIAAWGVAMSLHEPGASEDIEGKVVWHCGSLKGDKHGHTHLPWSLHAGRVTPWVLAADREDHRVKDMGHQPAFLACCIV